MKKIFVSFFTLALVVMCLVTVSAKTDTAINENWNRSEGFKKDVNVTVVSDPVYKIDIKWGNNDSDDDLTFKYTGEWNPNSHKYTGAWDSATKDIELTNHSNAKVSYDAQFLGNKSATSTKSGVTATIDAGAKEISMYEDEKAGTASIKVSVEGTPTKTTKFKIDTVVINFKTAE